MANKLTLKKDNYLFKSLNITDAGRSSIGLIQNNFENFWKSLSKHCVFNEEFGHCLDKLKEACAWACRGVAKIHLEKTETEENT